MSRVFGGGKKELLMAKQVVAIGGGKGGVGKSLVAVNLAIAFAQRGRRTVLIDADLGGANLHTLFGIRRPEALLEHFLNRKVASLEEILIPSSQNGLHLICGGMPVLGTANPKHTQKTKLIRHILALDFEVVLMDIGAGTGYNALDLFNAADYRLVVFTPHLTSLHNGYGFLKAALHRRLERLLDKDVRTHLQTTSPETGAESIASVLRRIAAFDIDEVDKADVILENQRIFLVGNMIRKEKERHVVGALRQMISDHLQIDAELLGAVKFGEKLERSVNERHPFMLNAGIESNAEVFRSMAVKLVRRHREADGKGRTSDIEALDRHPAGEPKGSKYDRQDVRYPTYHLSAELQVGKSTLAGQVLNVSHGGALLAFDESVPEPSDGKMTIGPSRGGNWLEAEVEERHRTRAGTLVGYAFVEPDAACEQAIIELVAEAAATGEEEKAPRLAEPFGEV
jgi:flagellar biosynthesis protein FlhG